MDIADYEVFKKLISIECVVETIHFGVLLSKQLNSRENWVGNQRFSMNKDLIGRLSDIRYIKNM